MNWKIHPAAALLIAILTIVGFAVAAISCEPHWVNRFGALIATLSGGFVVWELWLERQEDSDSTHKKAADRKIGNSDFKPSLRERLSLRISAARMRAIKRAQSLRKESFTLGHVVGACFGELLHGWGDLLAKWLISMLVVCDGAGH